MESLRPSHIAVIGMSGRFPGAPTVARFWDNLTRGVEGLTHFSDAELLAAGVDAADLADPGYVKTGAVLQDYELFDHEFFGFTLREAEITDPQHRLFLECAWEALENAGYDPETYPGPIGVYAGSSLSTYLMRLLSRPDVIRGLGRFRTVLGNDKDFLPTWTSYKLNLKGPSVNIQASCSTSLVAVHLACQSLLNQECDMALAGGATVSAQQRSGYFFQEGGILSPDGHCRAFDARAQGTVGGNGVGVVVLKRFEDAWRDGDRIRAVLLGSAINNDGSVKVGYTAPSIEGQSRVISEALAVAGVEPESVGYVEAHGTGTTLGDPIEVEALTLAFEGAPRRSCAIGSVKTNVGHLDAASGVTGLIKTVFALEHGVIPPSLHFERPNPRIDFDQTPFYVNATLAQWTPEGGPRRAGVSSFGIGGTNAHVVLEAAPPREPSSSSLSRQLLVLSARTRTALEAATANLAGHLRERPDLALADVAYTLQTGRRAFAWRRAIVCGDVEEAVEALTGLDAIRVVTSSGEATGRGAAFLFPGQGAQHPGMAAGVYRAEAGFRAEVDRCAEMLAPRLGLDLRDLLFRGEAADGALDQTAVAQPALFVIEYALARLLMSWGIEPAAMIGHSLGEYVAACLAGVFSLEDALALVAERGRLMQSLPGGAMLAVTLAVDELQPWLGEGLSLAAVNGPARSVVSGTAPAIAELEAELGHRGIACRRMHTSHAFHSSMMDPAVAPFVESVKRLRLSPPRIPFLSNVSGTWITPDEATSPDYWGRHLRLPVQFAKGLAEVRGRQDLALLEVGPGQVLGTLARQSPGPAMVFSTLGHPRDRERQDDLGSVLAAVGALWCAGVPVDWPRLHAPERRLRIPLPTYPFERKRCWIDPPRNVVAAAGAGETDIQGSEEPMAEAQAAAEVRSATDSILTLLGQIVYRLVGADPAEIDVHKPFLELGVDSLLLIQFGQEVKRETGVRISLTQLLEELTTLSVVAAHIDRELPPDARARICGEPAASLPTEPARAASLPPAAPEARVAESLLERRATGTTQGPSASSLEQLFEHQLQLVSGVISQQLDLLRQGGAARVPIAAPAPAPEPAPPRKPQPEAFVPFQQIEPGTTGDLTPRQEAHLRELVDFYTKRTGGSKRLADQHRLALADNRNSVGFRLLWKEMVYPIVARRTAGSRMWDVDGNEYVDVAMGFGVYLFGHSPEFIVRALRDQLDLGIHIGPQSDLAGEVAGLISEMTGVERVAFANSGTEAVMVAMRLVRAVTGRTKIAMFAGSYHGTSDGVLARGAGSEGALRSVPMAPGVPEKMVEDVILLDYPEPSALDYIRRHGHELAAVLVEPVQGRRPEVQPREFLLELRQLTERAGCALIFDEVVTGFRCHPGGAQAWFGVKADIVTYGKVVGGGMPIGVVSGKAEFLDAIDGGPWRFGDGSYPQVDKTMFAGTFCKHPLSMAATRAVLRHLKGEGPALQEELNRRTTELARTLNAWFEESSLPVKVVHFGSLFRLMPTAGRFRDLFFFHLVKNGIYVWEGNTCFLTTAHSEQDVALLTAAIRRSCEEMREGGFFPEAPSAVRRSPERGGIREVPLTDGQREIWILSQMSPDVSCAYNESTTLDLKGPLDVAALRRAFQRVVDRHQALRSTVGPEGEALRVAPRLAMPLPLVDFTHLEDPESDPSNPNVEEWIRGESSRPFDLVDGPLLRASLVKLGEERHLLVVTIHHLVIDGVSYGVFLNDLSVLYAAERGLAEPRLQEPRQFADYVELERSARLQDVRQAEEDEAYWSAELSGPLPVLSLPTDRPRPPVQTHGVERYSVAFPAALYRQAQELSARHGATLFASLLAVFNVLLAKLTGQDDVVVAISAAGQVAMGERNLVGYCVRPLLVRSRLSPSLRFSELLRSVKRSVLGAYEHQAYPLSRLVKTLSPRRDPSRPPLAPVVFNVDRSTSPNFPGLDVEIVTNPTGSKVELYWSLIETGTGLSLDCDFNPDLFDQATIARWAESFEALLAAVMEGDPLLADLPDAGEPLSPLAGLTLPERFSWWASREPSLPALRFGERRMSYGELEASANRLARYLRRQGVGPESLVGLSMERSPELIVALLGIFKAGAAYLPLDPGYPLARLAYMLEDSGVELLLTGPGSPALDGVRRLDVESEQAAIEAESGAPLPGSPAPESLAYVIYTSGSTGRPKGVMVGHRGLANLAEAQVAPFGASPGKRILQFAPLSFDASIFEIAMAYGVGAALVLARQETLVPGPEFLGLLRDHGVTHVTLPPSALAALPESELSELEMIVCAGEALPESLVERWGAGRRLFNAYGPTESTVWATVSLCRPGGGKPDIGRAISGARVLLLDADLRAVPQGASGEIFLGGVGLARGYLGRPDLTAERFVPDPWSGEPGARLYRTGDLGRWLPDGRLDFLGRADHQVKIRGFRIEIGEVEAALGTHPELREAAVVAHEDEQGKSLVAYVVARREPGPTVTDLRRYLKERLPEHMVPSSFQVLAELPHSPSGKVDRAALPAPGQERPALAEELVLPRSEAERLLVQIWCEVLGLDQVGIHDNFFELGGDSILAFQITSRASRAGLSLSPIQLFRMPTIADLAAAAGAPPETADVPEPEGDEVPLTPIQQWFFDLRIPTPGHFNQAVLLQSAEPLDARRLETVLAAILRQHDALRLRFTASGDRWRQRQAGGAEPVPFLVVDLGRLPEEAQAKALEQTAFRLQESLDLSRGPLTRLAVFRLGQGKADRLLWILHHLAVDGISWRVLLEDLYTGYHQLALGETLDLPPATTPFRRWAERLRSHAGSDRLRSELDYWLDERRSRIAPLPVDLPGGRNTEDSADTVTVSLDRHETRSLLQDVTAAFQTRINDALLTALGLTLGDWTGRRSALIDLEGHGREPMDDDLDLARTVGWFTTLFPVLLDLGPEGGSIDETVKRVHQQLSRIPHRGLGYGVLRYLSEDPAVRDRLAAFPLAEIGFNYLGQFDTVLPGTARWSLAPEPSGPTRGSGGDRLKLLEINGMVTGGRLSLQWSYSRNLHRRQTVERLAEDMLARLRALVDRALALTAGEFQATEFADFDWSQKEVNEIAAAIGRAKGRNGSGPALEPRK